MNKSISSAVLIGCMASVANATEPTVEITSFYYAGAKTRSAELCGKIIGETAYPVFIKVTVDPKAKTPGIYTVAAMSETFCTAIVTSTGTADATVWK